MSRRYSSAYVNEDRFVTRGWITRKFGVDDAFIAGAIVSRLISIRWYIADEMKILGAGQTGTIILQVKNGRGRHTQELSIEQVNNALMVSCVNSNIALYIDGHSSSGSIC